MKSCVSSQLPEFPQPPSNLWTPLVKSSHKPLSERTTCHKKCSHHKLSQKMFPSTSDVTTYHVKLSHLGKVLLGWRVACILAMPSSVTKITGFSDTQCFSNYYCVHFTRKGCSTCIYKYTTHFLMIPGTPKSNFGYPKNLISGRYPFCH